MRQAQAEGQAIIFERTSIIFGDPSQQARALERADAGASRAEIAAETGAILGCHDCSLGVAPGEISVLMGLSGSGKSTLLRAVNALNPVTRGRVLVRHEARGVDVTSCDAASLRAVRQNTVSMVFQQFGLLPWRTVAENVGFGLELAGMPAAERRARVEAQLALVNMTDRADARVHELSGGMQQRVGLARAFATNAPIFLMDEPFSALDPLIRARLQDQLLEWQRELGCTILFVSHDLDEALKIGSRITIMEGGRILQSGTPEEIVLHPVNDHVRDFIANVNPLSVLGAWNVMRDRRDLDAVGDGAGDGAGGGTRVWLDRRHSVTARLDGEGRLIACERGGLPMRVLGGVTALAREQSGEADDILIAAAPETALREVMDAMWLNRAAPMPVLDPEGRLVGAIGVRDVLGAILRR